MWSVAVPPAKSKDLALTMSSAMGDVTLSERLAERNLCNLPKAI